MSIPFLQNKNYSFSIAKIVIIFQSIITFIISIFLVLFLSGIFLPLYLLKIALLLDILFVIIHLTYRVLYAGEKVKLVRSLKIVLVIHSVTSFVAIGMTFFAVKNNLREGAVYSVCTLIVWSVSLISGIEFFTKKYYHLR